MEGNEQIVRLIKVKESQPIISSRHFFGEVLSLFGFYLFNLDIIPYVFFNL
jgi:hypothetical protein